MGRSTLRQQWYFKTVLQKQSLLHVGKQQRMQELWELGRKWEETAKKCLAEGNMRKTIWDQLLKSLECHAKNFLLYPPGNKQLQGLLAGE